MRSVLILFAAALATYGVQAQGCSDAGFCTIGNLSHQAAKPQSKGHQFKMSLPFGQGDAAVFVFTPALEYTFLRQRWQLSGKVTANHASGDLARVSGAGDLFLSATYQLPPRQHAHFSFTLGAKMPLSNGNLKAGDRSLPMQYQSSLGTVDLIMGIAVAAGRWKAAAGWQQPLTGRNRNNFLPQYWPDDKAMPYPPTNDFNRRGDVLLRTSWRVVQQKRITVEGGLLGIWHLGEDTYVDANISSMPIALQGSEGLTLNATALVEVALDKRWSVGLIGGVPLVVRDVRPDGLTRSFVVSPQVTFKW